MMPSARPARLLSHFVPRPGVATTSRRSASSSSSSSSQIIRPDQPATPELDPSFIPFLKSVDLATHRRKPRRPELDVVQSRLVSSHTDDSGPINLEEEDGEDLEVEDELSERRSERRSPATVLGSKRLGIAVLPEELVDGVQSLIDGEISRIDSHTS